MHRAMLEDTNAAMHLLLIRDEIIVMDHLSPCSHLIGLPPTNHIEPDCWDAGIRLESQLYLARQRPDLQH